MDSVRSERVGLPSESTNGARTCSPPVQPNYTCKKVQAALQHLASIDLIDLCNEAKVEHCRATRDLRSCGRFVQSVLNSCGHASLCEECGQRCDTCPICRIPLPKHGTRLRLRLFYECIEAGLISKRCDDRFQEKDGEKQSAADVERLYAFFDVAMENNLISLICQYITDVCMDESAVSSDPVVAVLLDEVVVKDWCKRTFKNIVSELEGIYKLSVKDMQERSSSLLKFLVKLESIANVLETLELSFRDSFSAELHDVHHLQECVLKTKQHMEMMVWCLRHGFLENISRHSTYTSWRSIVRDRKLAAIKRAWPDVIKENSTRQENGTLFIEDALSNLDIEHGYSSEMGDGLEIACLQKDGGSSFSRFKIEGMVGCYPFEDLRSAIDILFLCGSSDLIVAKRAIFLYYLFDRHWGMPAEKWRNYIDDFAATFNISRQSTLESLTFYLLDDDSEKALQEASHLLPEISGPTTHPKVAQVLLERQNPYVALMVLRWSGRDGGSELISLGEAVTAVRVRVECGLLVEAFVCQRSLCDKVKEVGLKQEKYHDASNESKEDCHSYKEWLEVLVTEICLLCIRRNLVDRIIGLPWNFDEQKQLHNCLLDYALVNPLSSTGSLLVVFYLQRYRYKEAYKVDCKLQSVEQEFISENSVSEEVITKIRSTIRWRAGLVEKSLQLLPEVEQQDVRSGKSPEVGRSGDYDDVPSTSDLPKVQEPMFASLLVPSSVDSSLAFGMESGFPSSKPSVPETPSRLGGSVDISHLSNHFPPEASPMNGVNSSNTNFNFDGISTSASRPIRPVLTTTPLKEFNRSSLKFSHNGYLQSSKLNLLSSDKEENGLIKQFQNSSPYIRRVAANPSTSVGASNGIREVSPQNAYIKVSGVHVISDITSRAKNVDAMGDTMDFSWSNKEDTTSEQMNVNGRPRWRSDADSDDEEQQTIEKLLGAAANNTPSRRTRTTRFIRR